MQFGGLTGHERFYNPLQMHDALRIGDQSATDLEKMLGVGPQTPVPVILIRVRLVSLLMPHPDQATGRLSCPEARVPLRSSAGPPRVWATSGLRPRLGATLELGSSMRYNPFKWHLLR